MEPEVIPVRRVEYSEKRWLLLTAVALLNFSSTFSWIMFSTVSNYVDSFYGHESAVWFSLIFMGVSIPMGLAAITIGSGCGMGTAINVAAACNVIGAIIRILSVIEFISFRFGLCLFGQLIAAMAYPFMMFLPAKLSAEWFPPPQRAMATTIGLMSSPLAVMLANLLVPVIVTSPKDVIILNISVGVLCAFVAILSGYATSEMKNWIHRPVSPLVVLTCTQSLHECLSNMPYVLLMIILGGGIGMFNCLYTMMSVILCPAGYTKIVASACATLMITFGVVGSAIAGYVLGVTRMYKEILYVTLGCAVLFGLIFLQLTRVPGIPVLLFFFSGLFGLAGLASYPVGLELAAECAYPVLSEYYSGFIILSGQAFSVLFVFIVKYYAISLDSAEIVSGPQVCQLGAEDPINLPKDYSASFIIISLIAVALVALLPCIHPKYKRMEEEMSNGEQVEENDKKALKSNFFSCIRSDSPEPEVVVPQEVIAPQQQPAEGSVQELCD
ncbi:unnamed protein product [Caenorhabditis sp. 36 PRJEB53466]|nr:unnamed protein product [Caenorhabditis sp. 36 PRJEB53466]